MTNPIIHTASNFKYGDKYHRIFFCADLHFGHKNIAKWRSELGFASDDLSHHDNTLIENWNSKVAYDDKVYVLGDFCWNAEAFRLVPRLNGRILLIGGNHDTKYYQRYTQFDNVKLIGGLLDYTVPGLEKRFVLSHAPVHPSQIVPEGRWDYNIHGHLHHIPLNDDRYICVSMEQISYVPISFAELITTYVQNSYES